MANPNDPKQNPGQQQQNNPPRPGQGGGGQQGGWTKARPAATGRRTTGVRVSNHKSLARVASTAVMRTGTAKLKLVFHGDDPADPAGSSF